MKTHQALLRRPVFSYGGIFLCLQLLALPPSHLVGQQPGAAAELTLKEIARPAYAAAEFELNQIDDAEFDVAAAQKKIGTDPAAITGWVRDETRWLPYSGALKGANGAMLARQGNLLDRALLLAALIEEAGREVRIVHFETSEDQRRTLRDAAATQQNGGHTGFRRGALQPERLEEFRKASGLDEEEASLLIGRRVKAEERVETALSDTLARHRDALTELIQDAIAPEAGEDAWAGALNRYFFVQHRRSKNDPWESAHLVASPPVTDAVPGAFPPNEIPAEWLHQVEIKVIAVQKRGDKEKEQVALEKAFATAYSGASPVRIQLVPNNLTDVNSVIEEMQETGSVAPFTRRLAGTRAWAPTIRHGAERASTGSAIDRNGRLVSISQFGPGGRNEDNLTKALGGLNQLLGDAPASERAGVLKEVRIDFVFTGPGLDEPRVVERPVYSAPANAGTELSDAQLLERSLNLTGQISLLLTGGHLSPDFATRQQATTKLGLRLATDYISAKNEDEWLKQIDADTVLKIAGKFDQFPTKLYGIAAARSSADSFLGRPNVIALWERMSPRGTDGLAFLSSIDFVENRVEITANDPMKKFRARMDSGLRDSIIETEAAPRRGVASVTSTSRFFEKDGREGWQTITDPGAPLLQTLAIPRAASKAIHRDLESGYLLVMRPDISGGDCAWWRIDPHSGECLGMLGSEYRIGGENKTEYVIIFAAVIAAVAIAFRVAKIILRPTKNAFEHVEEELDTFNEDL